MSFAKAQVKRFNEYKGCAPAPGTYEVSQPKQGAGVLSFEVGGERFKDTDSSSDTASDLSVQLSTTFITPSAPPSKKKLNFAQSEKVKPKSNKSTPRPSPAIQNKEKQEFEKEIRRLLQQVNEQDKEILSKSQDIKKLEYRVSLLSKEKCCILTQVATAEKKTAELERKNSILQSQKTTEVDKQRKREDLEDELKKTKIKLETAKQELDKCRSLLVSLQSDLESARATIKALQQSNNVLTQLNKEVQEHSDDVSSQVTKLQGLADILRAEKLEAEEQLSLVKDKLQNVEIEFTTLLQDKAREIQIEFEKKQENISNRLQNAEAKLSESNSKTAELKQIIEQLELESKDKDRQQIDLQTKLSNLVEEKSILNEDIRVLKTQMTASCDKTTKIEQEKSDLESKIKELECELLRVKSVYEEESKLLQSELKELKENYETSVRSVEGTKENLEALNSEKDELNERLEELMKHNDDSLRKLQESQEAKNAFIGKIASLESELDRAHGEIEDVTALSEIQSKDYQELRKQKKELEYILEKSKKDKNEFQDQIDVLETKADVLESQLLRANQLVSTANENEEAANTRIGKLEERIKDTKDQYQAKLSEFTRRLLETQKKLNHKHEELQNLLEAKESDVTEMRKLRKLIEEQGAKLHDVERISRDNSHLSEKVTKLRLEIDSLKQEKQKLAEVEAHSSELNKWKDMYHDLSEKVEPFKGQIEAYAAEKASLLNENSAAQAEMQALGKKYAELLGHQNQKQKIRHVVKIKEENLALKQEMGKLRAQISKLQKQALANRPRNFDPAEAFQHKKENATPLSHNN